MKRLLLATAALTLGFSAIGFAHSPAVETHADDYRDNVKALLAGYAPSHTYTKKTAIYLNEATRTAQSILFHNGHNALERTTYYDEVTDALLMGNYDGTFGDGKTAGLNSGYIKEDDHMRHFTYSGYAAASTEDLYSNIVKDYSVADTSPNEYFVTLSKLADSVGTVTWTKDDSDNYYYNPDIAMESVDPETHVGVYSDPVLKDIVYFAAPMLLQNNFFTISFIQVRASDSCLSIRIYVDSTDSGMVTVFGGGRYLLAEARVYNGLSLTPEKVWKLHSTKYDWKVEDEPVFEYEPDAWEAEQYKIVETMGHEVQFGVKGPSTEWYSYSALENRNWFTEYSGNIRTSAYEQEYTIFFKPNSGRIYVAYDVITVNIVVNDAWLDANPIPRIHAWKVVDDSPVAYDTWAGFAMSGEGYNYTLGVPNSADYIIVSRTNPYDSGNAWNQTANIPLADYGATITVTYTAADAYTIA